MYILQLRYKYKTFQASPLGRHLATTYVGQTGQTEQTGRTGRTGQTFRFNFPGNLCSAAVAILVIFTDYDQL